MNVIRKISTHAEFKHPCTSAAGAEFVHLKLGLSSLLFAHPLTDKDHRREKG